MREVRSMSGSLIALLPAPHPQLTRLSTFSSRSILWAGGQACWLLIAALLVQLDDLKSFV